MTENEWLTASDPLPMLQFLQGRVSGRKLLRFAIACCWPVWPFQERRRARHAVELTDRYADGQILVEVIASLRDTWDWGGNAAVNELLEVAQRVPIRAASRPAAPPDDLVSRVIECAAHASHWIRRQGADSRSGWLRDIVGNPFRPVVFDATWRTPAAVALARTVHEERCFEELPLLADALEEAGCTDAQVLSHCRGGGEQVRGCWVVALVLGRE